MFLDRADAGRLASATRLSPRAFLRRYTEKGPDGARVLRWPDDHCVFLGEKGCEVYADRPAQCRTWPFWPETLRKGVWEKEVVPFCPGAGEGRLYSIGELRKIARGEAETGHP